MQGLIRCVCVAGMLVGCNPGDSDTPDAPDTPGDSGLIIEWSSAPAPIPGGVRDGLTIDAARFSLDNLRVVGDAGPGDPRTTTSIVDLRWGCDSDGCAGVETPDAITFDDAPPGLYSQVAIRLDGSSFSTQPSAFRIEGEVRVDTQLWEYRIESDIPLAFNVNIDEMLSAGEAATLHLRVNFAHALDAIDWSLLDTGDSRLDLDDSEAQMATFRAKVVESFELISVTSVR